MAIELWQIHATIVVTGLLLVVLVGLIARFLRKKPWWFKLHRTLALLTILIVASGVITAIYMVTIGGGAHFTLPHHWLGLTSLVFVIVTVLVGYLRPRLGLSRIQYRWIHISLAFITAILMLLTIYFGFRLVY